MFTHLWDRKDLAFLCGESHPKVKEKNYGIHNIKVDKLGKLKVVCSLHFNNVSNLLKVIIMAQFHGYAS